MCVVDLGQQLGIEDLNANDITEEIAFECKNLENEDLFALKDQLKSDDEASEKPTELSSKVLDEIIQKFEHACDFAKENDPNGTRSSVIVQKVLDSIVSYKEEAKENLKKKEEFKQRSMFDFFDPK